MVRKGKSKSKKIEKQPLLNENIPFSRILLISEDSQEKREISRQEALNQAKENGLDLLCVSPSTTPPVCKLVNYYQLSKKKKTKKPDPNKEFSISFNIGDNDLERKLNEIYSWLEKGSTVKVSLVRHGKEKIIEKSEMAEAKCHEIIAKLKEKSSQIELRDTIKRHFSSFYFFLYKRKQ